MGANFKTGIIWRPVQALRLGAAIHTPTLLQITPEHATRMDTYFNPPPPLDELEPGMGECYAQYESYTVTTPWRYNFSAAAVIGTLGSVDVDVEIVDYSTASITPQSTYDFINDDISSVLKTAINLKAGAEIRLGRLYLRGGVAYYGNPYNKDAFDEDFKSTLKASMNYSCGIGFRNRDFYMDAAYSYLKHPERTHTMYQSYDDSGICRLQTNSSKVVITFGFKF
jgi:hypothetical protein